MIEEGEKENERSEATTTRQRIEERVLLVRFDAHDVTIIEWRCNFSILGAFGYVVANRLLGDRSNLRFVSVTMLDLFPRYRHFERASKSTISIQVSIYREQWSRSRGNPS